MMRDDVSRDPADPGIGRILAAAARHGKATGVLMPKPDDFERYHALGFRFLACGSDGAMVNNAARALAQTLAEKRRLRGG